MKLYCGIDLHSTNNYVALLDDDRQTVLSRKLPNRLEAVLGCLQPYRQQLVAIAVESTFNWYWLVDGLMDNDYRVELVNTSAIRKYEGLKYLDDRHDARWLAHLLQLGILPTGYIYPKQERALRDLLRRRTSLVRQRTANLLSLKNIFSRQMGRQFPINEITRLMPTTFRRYVPEQSLLLPPSPRDWLPEGHLAYFLSDTVDALDLTAFYE
ncbi:MAG TPA: transposase, partial [Thermoanaerobaculia bacterium]|nr:transposase [Thermoanaerobaculia bacterium]